MVEGEDIVRVSDLRRSLDDWLHLVCVLIRRTGSGWQVGVLGRAETEAV